jgi:hypothetical protein
MASRSQTPGGVTASASRTKTRKSAVQPDDPAAPATTIPEDMRRQWVAEAAYFIAERRGFGEGCRWAESVAGRATGVKFMITTTWPPLRSRRSQLTTE